jgi:probable phosphoglycerate mutase
MNDTILDFIRHGKPSGSSSYRGHGIDDPLGEVGWNQMWDAIHGAHPWQQVISSPLVRCSHFARSLASQYDIPVHIEDRFKEVGFGEWEGRTRAEIQSSSPEAYEAFYRDPVNNRPPGAESLVDFFQRVSDGVDGLVARSPGQNILVVGHAGVIRAVLAHVLLIPPILAYRIKVDHAGITRIRYGEFGVNLEFHNRSSM